MRMITLAVKDMNQIMRDRRSFFFLVAMPVAFTLFMGFIYGRSADGGAQDTSLSLAWVPPAPAAGLSELLYARLAESGAVQLRRMQQKAALAALEKGEVDGLLVVPAGIGGLPQLDLVADLPGERIHGQLRLIADPSSVKGTALLRLLRSHLLQLMSAVKIGQLSARVSGDARDIWRSADLARELWEQKTSQGLLQIEQNEAQEPESWFGDNPYNQASPGILVQFTIMGLITTAQVLVRERKSRTLLRQRTTGMPPWQILGGHLLAMFGVIFMQTGLLVMFGQLLLGVGYLQAPMAVLLIAAALALWVSSMGVLIALLARGDDQVNMLAMIAMFLFSALGGAWFPLESAGRVFTAAGNLMPSAWAVKGFQNILIHGLGISSAWQPAAVLTAYALVFIILSLWRFKKMEV